MEKRELTAEILAKTLYCGELKVKNLVKFFYSPNGFFSVMGKMKEGDWIDFSFFTYMNGTVACDIGSRKESVGWFSGEGEDEYEAFYVAVLDIIKKEEKAKRRKASRAKKKIL
ncbi:MAG: hypothetical protein OEY89_02485 [Gammaproteobacteria bacterium]|nr:hypothetical protein [Gammaproteobacteria bacterium]